MTGRVSRLAGAILLEADGQQYLIGNTKEPCDWAASRFESPAQIDAVRQPWIRLEGEGPGIQPALVFTSDAVDAPAIAQMLASRFLIRRNGSVSERLWRIVTGQDDETGSVNARDATWLLSMPDRIWEIVREAALKCL
jgi:hypothetical protein